MSHICKTFYKDQSAENKNTIRSNRKNRLAGIVMGVMYGCGGGFFLVAFVGSGRLVEVFGVMVCSFMSLLEFSTLPKVKHVDYPECFLSNPNITTQAENDCESCPFVSSCIFSEQKD